MESILVPCLFVHNLYKYFVIVFEIVFQLIADTIF